MRKRLFFLVQKLGMGLEALGYILELYGFTSRTGQDLDCPFDDTSSYKGYHPVKVGIGMEVISHLQKVLIFQKNIDGSTLSRALASP